MTKEEEKKLLYQYKDHYLWNKVRSDWTTEDLENLRNGITNSKTGPKKTIQSQAVLVINVNDKKRLKYPSVSDASKALNIGADLIYRIVNHKREQLEDYKFFKIN